MADGLGTQAFAEMAQPVLRALKAAHQGDLSYLEARDAYYNGEQPLSYIAPELLIELSDRMRQVVINWPMLVVDSLEERLDIEGFRMGGSPTASDDLWDIWQSNGLDLLFHQAQVDALALRRSYLCVGNRGQDDMDPSSGVDASIPLITVESPLQVYARRDPRTGRVRDAARWWVDGTGSGAERATLYLPDSTSWWVRKNSRWILDEDGSAGVDQHDLGVVPVVPVVNRPRTASNKPAVGGEGRSEIDPVIPLSDAACKIATDMMVGAESHALPRRWATGVDRADFYDADGNPRSHWSRLVDKIWGNENENVKFGQFNATDLSNFHSTLDSLAKLVAGLCGLPPHYLGLTTHNPASADAIRSEEARHVKRAERRQKTFGEAAERAMRIALLIRDGSVPPEARRMETMWRDAATPTRAQSADASVKLKVAGIISTRQAQEDLGYSPEQQDLMEDDLRREAAIAFGDPTAPETGTPSAPAAGEAGDPSGAEPAMAVAGV